MSRASNPVAGVWVCPYCSWTYTSPVAVRQVWHRCPSRGFDRRHLRAPDRATVDELRPNSRPR